MFADGVIRPTDEPAPKTRSVLAGYGDTAVAEHAIALMLAAARDVARMDREIRAGEKLEPPNIVKVLDAGSEGGKRFFTMELVEGLDFTRWARLELGIGGGATCEDTSFVGLDHTASDGSVDGSIVTTASSRSPVP